MTEIQAAIGKVQLGKLDFIVKKNRERYKELLQKISKKFHVRQDIKNSKGINDTFIF